MTRFSTVLGYGSALFFATVFAAEASITKITDPDAFSDKPQILVTFAGLRGQNPPIVRISEMDGVRFNWRGGPVDVAAGECGPHPFGPTRCESPVGADDEAIRAVDFGAPGPVEITLPFATTRIAFEIRFYVNSLVPRSTQVEFYSGTTPVGSASTQEHLNTGNPPWLFEGFASTSEFDRIVLTPPSGGLFLDNIRFDASQRFRFVSFSEINTANNGGVVLEFNRGPVTSESGLRFLHVNDTGVLGSTSQPFDGVPQFPASSWLRSMRPTITFEIDFPRPVRKVGLILRGIGGTINPPQRPAFMLTLLRGSEVVGSSLGVPQAAWPGWTTVGFEGPDRFTKLQITHLQAVLHIDDIYWEWAPPEPSCGDGATGSDEQCDDGNVADGDGCSLTCRAEDLPGDQRPVARCAQDFTIFQTDFNFCGATNFRIDGGSFDPEGPVSIHQFTTSIAIDRSTFLPTSVAVLQRATDVSGQFSDCYTVVRVRDGTPPTIFCNDIFAECQFNGGAQVTSSGAFAGDACHPSGDPVRLSCEPSTAFYLVGQNILGEFERPIVCNARDWAGNFAQCTPRVTVFDFTPPSVSCVAVANPSHPGGGQVTGQYFQVSGDDRCQSPALTLAGVPVFSGEILLVTRGGNEVRVLDPKSPHGGVRHFFVPRSIPLRVEAFDGTNRAVANCVAP